MKRMTGVLLGMVIYCATSGLAMAQQQSGMHDPPKVLVINREFIKPGHAGAMHEKTETAFVQAMTRANWPTHYLAMDSLSGKSRTLFLGGYGSLEDWEKDNRAIVKNASLSNALDQAAVADGNQLDQYDQSVFVYDENLSTHRGKIMYLVRYRTAMDSRSCPKNTR